MNNLLDPRVFIENYKTSFSETLFHKKQKGFIKVLNLKNRLSAVKTSDENSRLLLLSLSTSVFILESNWNPRFVKCVGAISLQASGRLSSELLKGEGDDK